jgi:hypothetical protein
VIDLGHISAAIGGATAYGIASYAARTFPMPQNPYGAWLVRVIQYALSNPDQAKREN